jgi:hypothetical protein
VAITENSVIKDDRFHKIKRCGKKHSEGTGYLEFRFAQCESITYYDSPSAARKKDNKFRKRLAVS